MLRLTCHVRRSFWTQWTLVNITLGRTPCNDTRVGYLGAFRLMLSPARNHHTEPFTLLSLRPAFNLRHVINRQPAGPSMKKTPKQIKDGSFFFSSSLDTDLHPFLSLNLLLSISRSSAELGRDEWHNCHLQRWWAKGWTELCLEWSVLLASIPSFRLYFNTAVHGRVRFWWKGAFFTFDHCRVWSHRVVTVSQWWVWLWDGGRAGYLWTSQTPLYLGGTFTTSTLANSEFQPGLAVI